MRLLASFLLFLSLVLAGCGKSNKDGSCTYHSDCADGELCRDSTCKAVECKSAEDCGFGRYCDGQFFCQDGCANDKGCAAGETCNAEKHTCKSYGCRSTELDCAYGQYCDTTTGECYEATEPLCKSCDISNTSDECGSSALCFYTEGDTCSSNADCEAGYDCVTRGGTSRCVSAFCLNECDPDQDDPCPRGFQCVRTSSGYYCNADCLFMTQGGYL